MEIKILGQGCKSCKNLYERTIQAKEALGIEAKVIKVEDIKDIVQYGVMRTPALVVDDQVKIAGKVPSIKEIKEVLIACND